MKTSRSSNGGTVRTQGKRSVVLINPPSEWLIEPRSDFPLGPLSLGAWLRHEGYAVEFVDGAAEVDVEHIVEMVPGGRDVYGISATTPALGYARDIASRLRRREPSALLVLGGPHVSARRVQAMEDAPEFDVGMQGEGEWLSRFLDAGGTDLTPGIIHRQEEIIRSRPQMRLDIPIDDLPFPAWDLIEVMSYQPTICSLPGRNEPGATLVTSRGCPQRCAFCVIPEIQPGPTRWNSVEYIMAQLNELNARFGFRAFHFVDDNFVSHRARTRDFCEAVAARGFHWRCSARTDTVDRELLTAMAAAGCVQIDYGVETASPRLLKLFAKGVTVEQHVAAIRMTREAGIASKVCLMSGLPQEDDQSTRETAQFIETTRPDAVCINRFVPFPGCAIEQEPARFGVTLPADPVWARYIQSARPGVAPQGFSLGPRQELFEQQIRAAVGSRWVGFELQRRASPRKGD